MRTCIRLTGLLASLLSLQSCQAQSSRYAYFVYCWGSVVKLDLRRDEVIANPQLKGLEPIQNYCTADNLLSLPEQQKLFVLSLTEPHEDPVPFRLLEYRLPSMVPVSQQDLPALDSPKQKLSIDHGAIGIGDAPTGHITEPKLAFDIRSSTLKPIPANSAKFAPHASMEELDQFLQGPDAHQIAFAVNPHWKDPTKVAAARAAEQGDVRLYSVYSGPDYRRSSAFVVVHGYNPGRLTVVRDAPYAETQDMHLSTNGETVLLQEAVSSLKPEQHQRTGRIVGYSSDTGQKLFDYRIPALRESAPPHDEKDIVQFVCMSPDRVTILSKNYSPVIVHGQTGRYTVIPKVSIDKNDYCTFMNQ